MNNINDLFDELFGKEENKQTALLYLSSLIGHTDNTQDLPVKIQQAKLLQAYLANRTIPNKDFYTEIVENILQILAKEQQTYQGGTR